MLFQTDGLPPETRIVSVETPSKVARIEGEEINIALPVIRTFFRKDRHPECYYILLSRERDGLRIDFVPHQREWIIEEGEENSGPAQPSCGRNVGYVLNKRGKIIRRVFSR
jgi:hypothetical protein